MNGECRCLSIGIRALRENSIFRTARRIVSVRPKIHGRQMRMTKPRYAIFTTLAALSLLCSFSSAHAEQAFQRFVPLMIDLDGWQGQKAEGLSMDMQDSTMTTVTRAYQRGSARLNAGIVVGPVAAGTLAPLQSGMNMQTSDGHLITTTWHGLQTIKSYNTPQKSGQFIVALGKQAMFSLAYNDMTEDEAQTLAEKFDWKAIQAALEKK
jgi:hypothetical protein